MTIGQDEPGPEAGPDPQRSFETEIDTSEVKARALSGVFVILSWNVLGLFIAFAGNVVLARLLTPRDFGVVAIGATVTLIAGALAEGGLGAGLMRRAEQPTQAELRTLTGIQLALTSAFAVLIIAVAVPFGTTGGVVAVMATSLPLIVLQSGSRVVFVRNLRFRAITTIDASGIVANYTVSIALVLAGLGVWGLALGAVVRALAATAVIPLLADGKIYRPTFEKVRTFRQIAGFGIRFQANWFVIVIREQTLNLTTAAIAGVATLGLWSLAYRLLVLANSIGDAVGRVTFPTMAHLLGERHDVRPLLERTARLTAVAAAIFLAAFAASTPGVVPALFGEAWVDIVPLFPVACAGTMILSTSAYPSIGYLFAADRPDIVLRASVAHAAAWILASAALLPFVGVTAIGIGFLLGACVEVAFVTPTVKRNVGANMVAPVVRPLLAGILGGIPGWLVAQSRPDLIGGIVGGALAAAVTLALLLVVARDDVRDMFALMVPVVRRALGRGASAHPVP